MAWRYVLAIVLSSVACYLWLTFFPPPRPPRPPVVAPAAAPAVPVAPGATPQAGLAPQAPGAQSPAQAAQPAALPARERKTITASLADRYGLTADSRGGCLAEVTLLEFHESVDDKAPYRLLQVPPGGPGVFTLEVEDPANGARPSIIPFDANWELEKTSPEGAPPVFTFKYDLNELSITKTITAGGPEFPLDGTEDAAPRHLKAAIELRSRTGNPVEVTYRLFGGVGLDTEDLRTPGADLSMVSGKWSGTQVLGEAQPAVKLTRWDQQGGDPAWISASNNYFAAILFPLPVEPGRRAPFVEKSFALGYPDEASLAQLAQQQYHRSLSELTPGERGVIAEKAYKNVAVAFRSIRVVLPGDGTPVRHEYGLYLGPREKKVIARYDLIGLDSVNQYGMTSALVRFFIWFLGVLRGIAFGSWGLAIVLLTFVVKLCLHPINKRTQAGMQRFQKQMQRIKPQMDELKTRFANNRQRMNVEMQKLWRENGVNPGQQMAGCLIMFLQLPIWIGLYTTLQYALGLRQASFLYIRDLTKPDMLFSFGSKLPLVGWEHFNLLPILYVVLTIVQQRLQPKPDDPQMRQQYNMMTFMMVFFGFIFYSFPAGFMLYIMTNAGLGILESKIIKAEIAREEAHREAAASAPGAGPAAGAMYPGRARRSEDERGRRGG